MLQYLNGGSDFSTQTKPALVSNVSAIELLPRVVKDL